jgi:hypothetical protein
MSTRLAAMATALLFLATIAVTICADELPATEKAKIERLIAHVKGLKDAVFIRNDVEFDAPTAARFLQGKWDANAAAIDTAEQFIEKAATVSSTTGKPYRIRFKDGTEVKSGDYLKERLKELK